VKQQSDRRDDDQPSEGATGNTTVERPTATAVAVLQQHCRSLN
jgi:hypothetical protein